MISPLKLRIEFGLQGKKRLIEWYKEVLDFPKIISFDGNNWEWLMYDKGHDGACDYMLVFAKYEGSIEGLSVPEFENMYGSEWEKKCECGAVYTSFPNEHMFYCPKWRPAKI